MKPDNQILEAKLYSKARPDDKQQERFEKFLKNKYGKEVPLEWISSDAFPGGVQA